MAGEEQAKIHDYINELLNAEDILAILVFERLCMRHSNGMKGRQRCKKTAMF